MLLVFNIRQDAIDDTKFDIVDYITRYVQQVNSVGQQKYVKMQI